MSELKATWTLELNCECPSCGENVDLMDGDDFWENNPIEICEWGTKKSKDVEAYCADCDFSFAVDLQY